MSVARIKALLRQHASDDQITLPEVQELIEAATDEGIVTVGEAFVLRAALDAHRAQFSAEAYEALKHFLEGTGRDG
jgi:hypothetical protein